MGQIHRLGRGPKYRAEEPVKTVAPGFMDLRSERRTRYVPVVRVTGSRQRSPRDIADRAMSCATPGWTTEDLARSPIPKPFRARC